MSETTPSGPGDNAEIRALISQLEHEIESVSDGLSKIRGTVARISYAASFAAPVLSPLGLDTPSDGRDEPAPLEEPVIAPAAAAPSVQVVVPAPPPLSFRAEPPVEPIPAEPPLWDSVAEGASWPRSTIRGVEAGFSGAPVPPPVSPEAVRGFEPAFDAGRWTAPEREVVAGPPSPTGWEIEPPAGVMPHEEAAPAFESPAGSDAQADAPVAGEVPAWTSETPDWTPDAAPAEERAEGLPARLSSGWPDESIWSQSFDWPAMKPGAPTVENDGALGSAAGVTDISDIVAQVRAELEAEAGHEAEQAWMPEGAAFDAAVPASDVAGEAAAPAPAVHGAPDDAARRDEVSRAVEEIRRQIEAGGMEAAMRSPGIETGMPVGAAPRDVPAWSNAELAVSGEDWGAAKPALEAGGGEAMGDDQKPAFRLAAPGSIPDWSHVQMEPSGPPVVVLKDADGRVELASVYETLSVLGCDDGAALLNYTPHSVTVGLPMTAQFPSAEQMADAVERVFGLTSRVESDGVRITVNIGADPKQRNVGAA